ncbi:MAG: biopolymer transporter ExbD [Saprospiraceae bacterium]|nr:biopolymer transporter ExbD [Saprospiraceae bacterium]
MAHFSKKRGKASPEVSTASLPDIIFMLLFFFMVVTVLRDGERKVKVVVPEATQLQKLEQKSLVNHIWIGKPVEKYQVTYGTKPRIQLGDKFASENEIPLFLEQHKIKVPEPQRPRITSSLKVDGDVTMGIVTDVKTILRKSGQLKINYSARPKQN